MDGDHFRGDHGARNHRGLAADDIITEHGIVQTVEGWKLWIEWDPATEGFVVPSEIVFDAILTREEAELLDGLLG